MSDNGSILEDDVYPLSPQTEPTKKKINQRLAEKTRDWLTKSRDNQSHLVSKMSISVHFNLSLNQDNLTIGTVNNSFALLLLHTPYQYLRQRRSYEI